VKASTDNLINAEPCNIKLVEASVKDIPIIREIAYKTWPVAYGQILSVEQLDYMLSRFYSDDTLACTIEADHQYLLAVSGDDIVGFCSFEIRHDSAHIHKLYVLPAAQKLGIGQKLLQAIEVKVSDAAMNRITLNVNRYNSAKDFYMRMNYTVGSEIDIEIGKGYLMQDYVMVKYLT
jgi:ribosomal protein S18 acetylase RimI-like enzyme